MALTILSPFFINIEGIPEIFFAVGALQAAVTFHLLSLSNSLYSMGSQYHSERLFIIGNKISESGMIAGFSTGMLIFLMVLWKAVTSESLNCFVPSPLCVEQHTVLFLLYIFTVSAEITFGFAMFRHQRSHGWFNHIQNLISETCSSKSAKTEISSYLVTSTPSEADNDFLIGRGPWPKKRGMFYMTTFWIVMAAFGSFADLEQSAGIWFMGDNFSIFQLVVWFIVLIVASVTTLSLINHIDTKTIKQEKRRPNIEDSYFQKILKRIT